MSIAAQISDKDFALIRQVIGERIGIVLTDAKREMVVSRLARHLRRLGLASISQYCAFIERGDDSEIDQLCNSITTNVTSFFRENHHFEHLAKELLPELDAKLPAGRPIMVWSAGCSSGEEPYSIAMTCIETLGTRRKVKILATDVDTDILDRAASGVYRTERVEGLTKARLERFFRRGKGTNSGKVRVTDELRDMISFKQLNLIQNWPLKAKFEFMFCRNVVIYFDKPTQRILFDRFANHLVGGATLFIGHSESLHGVTDRFEAQRHTMYVKVR